ncbi:MAG: NAD(P)H-dependent oxidoreductase [Candidatus Gastranaerophilales bacterium]|nr:NAD(P)H-dependent oxidoreductase [Candidatus Gastranaerophilales bacterium]
MNIFLINGHKYYPFSKGNLNKFIFNKIIELCEINNEIKSTIIEYGYEVSKEIEKFIWADIIIYQTPVNWFSVPWSLKKYIDDVYKAGVFYKPADKYGRGGLFNNKKYMLSLTCSTKKEEYENTKGFFNIRTIDDIFINFHKSHEYCAMEKINTFAVYDIYNNLDINEVEKKLKKHLERYLTKKTN